MALNWLFFILLFLLIFIVFIVLPIVYNSMKKPNNNPIQYLKNKNQSNTKESKNIFVCIGDSITHGRVGINYVDLIKKRLQEQFKDSFEIINAGINSEHAYNVLQRLDPIIKCNPDYISILIGTNDAHWSFKKRTQLWVKFTMHLAEIPTLRFYETSLDAVLTRLRKETHAKIAIYSLPTIGEETNHPIYNYIHQFNEIIKKLAEKHQLTYLPLFETMDRYLKDNLNSHPYPYRHQTLIMIGALFRRFIFRKDFDSIARTKGLLLHIDQLHLNSNGASICC